MGCASSSTKVDPSFGDSSSSAIDFKPVHSAVRWNNSYEEVCSFLETPEHVNCRDNVNGNRPIHIAAQNGHFDLVKLLLEREADIDAKNAKGNTALHMAVEYDYFDSCSLLMERGANVDLENDDGHPAIKGIEGTKSMPVCQLICAKITEDAIDSLNKCMNNMENIDKAGFVQSGLKVKKSMGAQWTDDCQKLFLQVLKNIPPENN
jgi:ankyrin repeat protein